MQCLAHALRFRPRPPRASKSSPANKPHAGSMRRVDPFKFVVHWFQNAGTTASGGFAPASPSRPPIAWARNFLGRTAPHGCNHPSLGLSAAGVVYQILLAGGVLVYLTPSQLTERSRCEVNRYRRNRGKGTLRKVPAICHSDLRLWPGGNGRSRR